MFSLEGRAPQGKKSPNVSAVAIQSYVRAYERSLADDGMLDEPEIEKAAKKLRDRLIAKLQSHRNKDRYRAEGAARAARHALFQELGPQRATEVLHLAAGGDADDYDYDYDYDREW